MKENITLQKPTYFIQNSHFFLKQIQETKNWNYNSVEQLPVSSSRHWRPHPVIFTIIIAIIIIPSPWGKIWGGSSGISGDASGSPIIWTAYVGELEGGWRAEGSPWTLGLLGCEEVDFASTLCWRELIRDVSLLLRQGGDLTIHNPDWSSSPSSSSLMKLASRVWRTSFSASVATFILFTKSCKTQSLQKSEQ